MTEFERELVIMFTEKLKEKDSEIKELKQSVDEHRAVARLYKDLYEDIMEGFEHEEYHL